MMGLGFSGIKKHPILIPLYACVVVGGIGAFFYTLRLALRSPDVSWANKKQSEPWNDYSDKQYKFYSSADFDKVKNRPPEF